MKQDKKTRELLLTHYKKYPKMQIQDIFKYLYQSSFGCEHMVLSLDRATDYIIEESKKCGESDTGLIDALDGEYSRVHLGYLKKGLSVSTLGKLFFESSKKENDGKEKLENKLKVVKELISQNLLPFSLNEFEVQENKWKLNGYPSVHHSEEFRVLYNPSYRVLSNEFVAFLPMLARLDEMLEKGSVVLAVDGGSASGKTTLSGILKKIYDCTVFHMDDFFLQPEQRTTKRFAEAGGNIDRERFLEEVINPLKNKKPVIYRKFDCSTFKISEGTKIIPEKLTVIEGAYSMHTAFGKYYDFSVFLDISDELQKNRIGKRNSTELARRFFTEWIPMEKTYFSEMKVKERSDLSILIE